MIVLDETVVDADFLHRPLAVAFKKKSSGIGKNSWFEDQNAVQWGGSGFDRLERTRSRGRHSRLQALGVSAGDNDRMRCVSRR